MVTVQFAYNNRKMSADAGVTVAEALVANGVRVGNYSVRLRRWREEHHPFKEVPSAWVTVDGVPNVNAYRVRILSGMEVASQTRMDVLTSIASRWPAGFYYRMFKRPEIVRKLFYREIEKHNDYGGAVEPLKAVNNSIAELEFSDSSTQDVDALIIGAGRAGIAASLEIDADRLSVFLMDRGDLNDIEKAYAHVVSESAEMQNIIKSATSPAKTLASTLASRGITLMANTTVFGHYDGLFAAISGESRVMLLKPRFVILCTGSDEIKPGFRNNDIPGVMTAASFLSMPEKCRVLYAREQTTLFLESRISRHETAEIASSARVRNLVIGYECDDAERKRIAEAFSVDAERMFAGTVAAAHGRSSIRQVTIRTVTGEKVRLATGLLILAGRKQPRIEIPYLMDMPLRFDSKLHMPLPAVDGTFRSGNAYACGSLAGMTGMASVASGLICGAVLSERLGRRTAGGEELRLWHSIVDSMEEGKQYLSAVEDGRCVLCPCLDVSAGDIATAIAEGYDTVNMIKRYTGLFMGPCQGARCLRNSLEYFTACSGREPDIPTVRPPVTPVCLGALARTSLQQAVDRE